MSDGLPVGVDLSRNELRESGSIRCIRSIRSILYTEYRPPLKLINSTGKQEEGGGVKIEVLVANPIIKLSFYLMFSFGLCGHFALGTLLET